jgi:hypothetical protein
MRKILTAVALFTIVLPAGITITPAAADASRADIAVAAKASPGFDVPYSWRSDTTKGAPDDAAGYDPINMVIVAKDGVTPAAIVGTLIGGEGRTAWYSVDIGTNALRDRCISAQDAAVQPKDKKQSEQNFSWRTVTCTSWRLLSSKSITNHVRGYLQKATGAWFLAVSQEHFCLVGKHGITPWHCITKNGYDNGRGQLIANLEAALAGEYEMSVTYSKPGEYYKAGEVPQKPLGYRAEYDGRVAIVTIAPQACAPIC